MWFYYFFLLGVESHDLLTFAKSSKLSLGLSCIQDPLFLQFNHPREDAPALKHATWEKDAQGNASDKQADCTVLSMCYRSIFISSYLMFFSPLFSFLLTLSSFFPTFCLVFIICLAICASLLPFLRAPPKHNNVSATLGFCFQALCLSCGSRLEHKCFR